MAGASIRFYQGKLCSGGEAIENVRQNVMIFCYQLGHIRTGQRKLKTYISDAKAEMKQYNSLVEQIKENSKERKSLLAEQKELPFWNFPKKKELTARIAELTELLEELRSEKAVVLQRLECADDSSLSSVKKDIAQSEAGLKKLEEQEQKYSAELDNALKQYAELKEQAAEFDPLELHQARQALRSDKEQSAIRRVQNTYGKAYNSMTMFDAKRETANLLGEEAESRSIRDRVRQKEQQTRQERQQPKKKKNRDWER